MQTQAVPAGSPRISPNLSLRRENRTPPRRPGSPSLLWSTAVGPQVASLISDFPGASGPDEPTPPPVTADGTGTYCQQDADCPGDGVDLCLSESGAGFCTREGSATGECQAPDVCCHSCSEMAAPMLPFEGSACVPGDDAITAVDWKLGRERRRQRMRRRRRQRRSLSRATSSRPSRRGSARPSGGPETAAPAARVALAERVATERQASRDRRAPTAQMGSPSPSWTADADEGRRSTSDHRHQAGSCCAAALRRPRAGARYESPDRPRRPTLPRRARLG